MYMLLNILRNASEVDYCKGNSYTHAHYAEKVGNSGTRHQGNLCGITIIDGVSYICTTNIM